MNLAISAPDLYIIAFGVLTLAILLLLIMIVDLKSKLKKFLIGSKTENLTESVESIQSSLKETGIFQEEMRDYLTTVEKRLKKSVQAVHTVRFNPFKGTGSGGNQSFATAFLNENGDGVVISTLYAREHISIFSKPVKKGISEYELSEEEKEAVAGAMAMVK